MPEAIAECVLTFPPICNTQRKRLELTCRAQELLRFEHNLIAYWLHHGLTQKQYDEGLIAGGYPFKITTLDSGQNPIVNNVALDTGVVKLSNRTKALLPKDTSEEDVSIHSLKGIVQEGFDARMIPAEKIPKSYEISGFVRKLKLTERHRFHVEYLDPKFKAVFNSLGILRPQFSNEDIEALGMEQRLDEEGKRDYQAELIAYETQKQSLPIWDDDIKIEDI